jgi:hypothetical protein
MSIITTLILFAASAWATSMGYPNAAYMLTVFAVISAATTVIPMATNDRFIHVMATVGSLFFAYIILQDVMVAGMQEFMELLMEGMLGAVDTTTIPYP